MTYSEIKARARDVFFRHYGKIVAALVLESIIMSVVAELPGIGFVAIFFLPLTIGINWMLFRVLADEDFSIKDIFSKSFDQYYFNYVGGLALMRLFVVLWSLLLVIPGIVKAYSYAATPFLLAKYPSLGAKAALDKSAFLMQGKRSRLLCLHFSFVGWILLGTLLIGTPAVGFLQAYMSSSSLLQMASFLTVPFGILFTFLFFYLFLVPYMKMSEAVFMDELFREAEEAGHLIPEEDSARPAIFDIVNSFAEETKEEADADIIPEDVPETTEEELPQE